MCFLVLSGRRSKGKAGVTEESGSNQAAVAEQGERRASKCGCFGKAWLERQEERTRNVELPGR